MDQNITILNANGSEECMDFTTEFVEVKFFVVVLFGSAVSLVSLIFNGFVFSVLTAHGKNSKERANFYYMYWLSIFDVFMAVSFILVVVVMVAMQYWQSLLMFHAWFWYLRPMFAISHVVVVTSGYLIVAATVQRYCKLMVKLRRIYVFMARRQLLVACLAFSTGVLTRAPVFFELRIETAENCTGFAQYNLDRTAITRNPYYKEYFMFYTRNIVSYLIPFSVLAFCNTSIVIILRRLKQQSITEPNRSQSARSPSLSSSSEHLNQSQTSPTFKRNQRRMKVDVETARSSSLSASTKMLVLVVTSWLSANALNIIILIWEFVDQDSLYQRPLFYALSSDITSISTILATIFRLPIYWNGNVAFRYQAKRTWKHLTNFCCLCNFCGLKRQNSDHNESRRKLAVIQNSFHANEKVLETLRQDHIDMNNLLQVHVDPDGLSLPAALPGTEEVVYSLLKENDYNNQLLSMNQNRIVI